MEREKEIFTFFKVKDWKTKVVFSMPILGKTDYDQEDIKQLALDEVEGALYIEIDSKS